jgi:hypothetical protein
MICHESVKVFSLRTHPLANGDSIMRIIGFCLLLIGMAACGPADSTSAGQEQAVDDLSADVEATVEQALAGDFGSDEVSEETCAIIEDGVIPELFGVDPEQVSYRRSIPVKRVGHVVCLASWDYPDRAEREAAFQQKIQEWGRGKATGSKEPMPKMSKLTASASVTLIATEYDSADAAIADLETSVARLQEGITVNVSGKDYTTQADFGDWIDTVGDRAIFSEKGELLVAFNGRRIAVNVSSSDDPAADQELALLLAERIMQSL